MSKKIFSPKIGRMSLLKYSKQICQVSLHYIKRWRRDVEHVVWEIEQRAIDITPTYKDWVELGFALVDGLGEKWTGVLSPH